MNTTETDTRRDAIVAEIDTLRAEALEIRSQVEAIDAEAARKVAPLRDRWQEIDRRTDELMAEARKLA